MSEKQTVRVTISIHLAECLLEQFKDKLDAGLPFGQHIVDDYDKFRKSFGWAKNRLTFQKRLAERSKDDD